MQAISVEGPLASGGPGNGSGAPVSGATVAVIGGSGLYELISPQESYEVETAYGRPSAPVAIGEAEGTRIAFIPRHGPQHEFPPHGINYRANLLALRSLGVKHVVAGYAVGALSTELDAGMIVVPDQLVDRTTREQTYVQEGASHIGFADPYCSGGRAAALQAAASVGEPIVDGGTMVVIEGPRFSTRAESKWFAGQGWSLINMTGHPEAALARELGMCFTALALVTDRDAGVEEGTGVIHAEVIARFAENAQRFGALLLRIAASLGEAPACSCASALEGFSLSLEAPLVRPVA